MPICTRHLSVIRNWMSRTSDERAKWTFTGPTNIQALATWRAFQLITEIAGIAATRAVVWSVWTSTSSMIQFHSRWAGHNRASWRRIIPFSFQPAFCFIVALRKRVANISFYKSSKCFGPYLKIESSFATKGTDWVEQISGWAWKVSICRWDKNRTRDLETIRLRPGPSVVGLTRSCFGSNKRITGIACKRANRAKIATSGALYGSMAGLELMHSTL